MAQFNVKGRYTDRNGRSHNFRLISGSSDRRYIEDLVRAQYPAKDVFINIVNQDFRWKSSLYFGDLNGQVTWLTRMGTRTINTISLLIEIATVEHPQKTNLTIKTTIVH